MSKCQADPGVTEGRPTEYYGSSLITENEFSLRWIVWFSICLIPCSLPGGYSVNYLFALTPIFYIIAGGKIHKLPILLKLLAVLSILIFVVATLYQVEFQNYFLRRLVSFILFMTMFSMAFINISNKMINSFLVALVIVSIGLAGNSIFSFFALGLSEDSGLAKESIGSQRTGYLYIIAFWVVVDWLFCHGRSLLLYKLLMLSVAMTILFGLILTFSRSSFVALAFSLPVFLWVYRKQLSLFSKSGLQRIIVIALVFVFGFFIISVRFPTIFDFVDQRLISLLVSGEMVERLGTSNTSEGTRIVIWTEVASFVFSNPITGSGFLGSWVLGSAEGVALGSAHNQYVDVFLRLGVLGFLLYIIIHYRLMIFLLKNNKPLFVGFMGVIAYGVFHETFKDSQGAVVFAFLLAYYSTVIRSVKKQKAGTH